MMNKTLLILLSAAAGLGTVLGVASMSGAQTVDGLDLAKVRANAREHQADADALSAEVSRRGDSLFGEAKSAAGGARANSDHYADQRRQSGRQDGLFDFDAMVKTAAGTAKSERGEAPQFIAFASLSMPPPALRQLMRDVPQAGGVVVFRGFPGNSVKAFTAGLARAAGEDRKLDNIGIDPRLFRAFRVDTVPTYVVTSSDFDLCDGFDCRTKLPPHDRISGNVTTEFALATFAGGGGPGAGIARLHLGRLQEESDR